jgi:TRAP-type C4-dicarboxylate transport system permease small subunit
MSDYLLIGFGVIDILLRLVGLVAFGYVIYGGFLYLTSQGEPDRTKAALGTLLNAVIGIVIAMFAAAIVSFIGNRLGA